jgi:hypothetical protein
MFTLSVIDETFEYASYTTLDEAIAEIVRTGWKNDASYLLSSPVLVHDERGHVVAIGSYTLDPDDIGHPLLTIHITGSKVLTHYKSPTVLSTAPSTASSTAKTIRWPRLHRRKRV